MTEPEYLHRCISCFSKWVRKTKIIDVPSLDWEAGLITIYNVEKYDKAKINLVD